MDTSKQQTNIFVPEYSMTKDDNPISPHSGHLSTMDDKIGPTGFHHIWRFHYNHSINHLYSSLFTIFIFPSINTFSGRATGGGGNVGSGATTFSKDRSQDSNKNASNWFQGVLKLRSSLFIEMFSVYGASFQYQDIPTLKNFIGNILFGWFSRVFHECLITNTI